METKTRHRSARVLSILALVSFLCRSSFAEEAAAPQPKVELQESIFDFGSVAQGSRIKHDFNVKNGGGADLVIQQVVPSCGCTAASATTAPITPGAQGSIHVEFDTTGFSGEKVKTVRIQTNDPNQPVSVVSLRGRVEPDVVVQPVRVDFGEVIRSSLSETKPKVVEISVREGRGVRVGAVSVRSAFIKVKEVDSKPTGKKLELSLAPEVPAGELREGIVVELSGSSGTQSINVPVIASVQGAVRLRPEVISYGVLEGKETLERVVKVENLSSEPLKVTSVSTDNPALTTELKTIQAGKIFVIKVKVDPAKVVRDLRAQVKVETDSKEEKELSFSVYGIVPPKVG